MRLMLRTPWQLIALCLLLSACGEKTIVREPTASTGDSTSASTESTGLTPDNPTEATVSPTAQTTISTTPDRLDEISAIASPTPGDNQNTDNGTQLAGNNENSHTEPPLQQGGIVGSNHTDSATNTPPGEETLLSDPTEVEISTNPIMLTNPVVTNPVVTNPIATNPTANNPAATNPTVNNPSSSIPPVNTPTGTTLVDSEFPEVSIDATSVAGSPGAAVNCQLTLPCSWISEDSQFTVTVTNADNIGRQDNLSIEYSVLTLHDTEAAIASTESATDELGVSFEPTALTFGEGIGGRIQGIQAGETILAAIEFDKPSSASSLSIWKIGLSDSGLIRQPEFNNIPVGSVTEQHTDCANVLPCAWVSPDRQVTITLLSASGFGSTNRLSTSFKVETSRNAIVALDSGATAVGVDGLSFEGRTHSLSVNTSSQKITASSVPGAQVAGTVYFSRTQTMSSSLQHLALVIYEDRPVPRWNPNFLSIPIQ